MFDPVVGPLCFWEGFYGIAPWEWYFYAKTTQEEHPLIRLACWKVDRDKDQMSNDKRAQMVV